ncbi:MAG: type II secretion system F family protein [Patescibacteria group bacterium]
MALFNYYARGGDGKQVAGIVEAANEQAAISLVKSKGLYIINIQRKDRESLLESIRNIRGVSGKDKVVFTRQLATMVAAGLPLPKSLEVLSQQMTNLQLKKIISEALHDVEGGAPLSVSFSKYSHVFSPTYIALLKAGEASGKMQEILLKLSETMESQQEFKSKVAAAMIYPLIVLVAMGGVMVVMMVFVIPKLSTMYESLKAELPLSTKILIGVSDFIISYWWFVIIMCIGLVIAFRYFSKTESGAILLSRIAFSLPIFGVINKEKDLTEFTQTFSLLIASGIPIVESLSIVSDAVGNVLLKESIVNAAKNVSKGYALSRYMRGDPNFPPVISQMVAVGEETGALDTVLERLSTYFASNAENAIKSLSTALEPIILIMLGGMVLLLILSIITPIYQITSSL